MIRKIYSMEKECLNVNDNLRVLSKSISKRLKVNGKIALYTVHKLFKIVFFFLPTKLFLSVFYSAKKKKNSIKGMESLEQTQIFKPLNTLQTFDILNFGLQR